jgi:hypothetical protein
VKAGRPKLGPVGQGFVPGVMSYSEEFQAGQ